MSLPDPEPWYCPKCDRQLPAARNRCYYCYPPGKKGAARVKIPLPPRPAPRPTAPLTAYRHAEPAPSAEELAGQVLSWLAWHRDQWSAPDRIAAGTKGTLAAVRAVLEALVQAGKVESRRAAKFRHGEEWVPIAPGSFERVLYRLVTSAPPSSD